MQTPTAESITLWKDTDAQLKGAERRKFRARVVRFLGWGGQVFAKRNMGWSLLTTRKGEKELRTGQDIKDQFHLRGRKPAEEPLPKLMEHIRAIIEPSSQTDPTFRTTQLYTPLTAGEVRKRLIADFSYLDEDLPSERTLRKKINKLGFFLKKWPNAVR